MPGSDSFPVHPLDAVLAGILLYSLYRGYRSGLILVVINSIALLLAVAFSFLFLDETCRFLQEYVEQDSVILSVAAFILILVLTFFGLKWFGSLMSSMIRTTLLGPVDQIAGALLGLFRMAFLLGSLLYGLELAGVRIENHVEGELKIFPVLRELGPGCLHLLSPLLPFLREILEKA